MPRPITLDHIPSEQHEGVGLVANSWAYLEGVLERLIWRLARLDDNRGACLTTHMSMPARLDAMNALADLELGDDSPFTIRLAQIAKTVRGDLAGKRNTIVHSRVLQIGEQPAVRATSRARGRLQKQVRFVVPEDYEETSKEILVAASELRMILAGLLDELRRIDGQPIP